MSDTPKTDEVWGSMHGSGYQMMLLCQKLERELAEAKRCPSCKNTFLQPFVCTTCGAEKLYDETLRIAQQRAEQAEAELATCKADSDRYRFLCKGEYQDDGEMWTAISNTSIKDEWDSEIDAAIKGNAT